MTSCGATTTNETATRSSAASLRTQRADLIAVARGLVPIERTVGRELAAARAAWPAISRGVPTSTTHRLRRSIALALAHAKAIPTPAFMARAGQLTGPAAALAGRLASFETLSQNCWQQVAATAAPRAARTSAAARFLRANAALYVGCIYDGHYNLSTIGEILEHAYRELGGPAAFGADLPPPELQALVRAYSPPATRLQPKPG